MWHSPNRVSANDQITISIIVPALREEKILAHTLSIYTPELRKRFGMELIVSDGGSSDATLSIASTLADSVVQHHSARRQTIAEGRNAGALVARGKVLAFINADTIPAEPSVFFQFIAKWSQSEGKFRDRAALACPVEVNPSERKWSDMLFHTFFNNYLKLISMLSIGVGRGECQIVRRDVFTELGGYNSSLAAGEDFDFFSRIARKHPIAIANELLVYESPRRYRRFGYMRILWSWFMNWVGAVFFSKSVSKEWEVVR